MAEESVPDYQPAVCHGETAEASESCPHRVHGAESTGRPIVNALARAETAVLAAVTTGDQYKCGLCGCPLANLDTTDEAPDDCPRLAYHR